ncbi:lipopolysaccharide biosynthesis protein [Sediminibacterium goheungense]|uniref:O-antigen/teichoic acid export membrane protein n=1 Tax=Sediminibacterium goheungense TaxID=1086393 RepID=A0A4R6J3V5_9BACT|nr:polysaccharide biosynthesis C-terminal domain-containing protein [Sediminibacterium goheungense]TDO28875.1 O-antigen/teichoic acid export membrane protein [Sediminibacterium goheungense]
MSSIKKLAGQTLWYGVPTIAVRFLGYALNILLFWWYEPSSTAGITQIYAAIPFLNILFTYGLETSYFRFIQDHDKTKVFNTFLTSTIITTVLFTGFLLWQAQAVAGLIDFADHPEYIRWMAWILFFDTLSVIPFAKLRQEGRPRMYAFIKASGIVVNVLLVLFFIGTCPKLYRENPESIWLSFYNPLIGIGYYIIANVVASIFTLLLLTKEFRGFRFAFDFALWKTVMKYSYPLIIVGLGGMINEMLSRLVYTRVLDLPRKEELHQLGIFGANYKVAVLITIFIQVFKMGAEPFFFNQSKEENAPRTYARVMKFFVIACAFMWLAIVVNLPIIMRFAYGSNAAAYGEGISIVPILAMGSVFLGIYYNLSVWYKLTNKTLTGAWITLAGAAITILLNIWWIPLFGYTGSAWATFACYAFMMIISYQLGQKHYRIPYASKKLIAYLVIVTLLYLIHQLFVYFLPQLWLGTAFGLLLLGVFAWFILLVERKEFQKMPVIGKYIK